MPPGRLLWGKLTYMAVSILAFALAVFGIAFVIKGITYVGTMRISDTWGEHALGFLQGTAGLVQTLDELGTTRARRPERDIARHRERRPTQMHAQPRALLPGKLSRRSVNCAGQFHRLVPDDQIPVTGRTAHAGIVPLLRRPDAMKMRAFRPN